MLFNDNQICGITTELQVAQKFIEAGYIVSVPYGNNSRYDLIVDTDTHMYRVQVKHASLNSNGSYTVSTCNKVSTTTQHKVKCYTKEDVDCIATIIENQLVILPIEWVGGARSKVMRVELPKSGTKSTCNLIKDFTMEKFII